MKGSLGLLLQLAFFLSIISRLGNLNIMKQIKQKLRQRDRPIPSSSGGRYQIQVVPKKVALRKRMRAVALLGVGIGSFFVLPSIPKLFPQQFFFDHFSLFLILIRALTAFAPLCTVLGELSRGEAAWCYGYQWQEATKLALDERGMAIRRGKVCYRYAWTDLLEVIPVRGFGLRPSCLGVLLPDNYLILSSTTPHFRALALRLLRRNRKHAKQQACFPLEPTAETRLPLEALEKHLKRERRRWLTASLLRIMVYVAIGLWGVVGAAERNFHLSAWLLMAVGSLFLLLADGIWSVFKLGAHWREVAALTYRQAICGEESGATKLRKRLEQATKLWFGGGYFTEEEILIAEQVLKRRAVRESGTAATKAGVPKNASQINVEASQSQHR